jgi:hypothetical protein
MIAFRRLAVVPLIAASACAPGAVAHGMLKAPELQSANVRCSFAKGTSAPLIVEWSTAERAKLEALSKTGILAVRASKCEMQVLPQCKGPGQYKYTATERRTHVEHIRSADDLFAQLPFGAVALQSTLQRSGELSVGMTIVGQYQADRTGIRRSDLVGECAEATHAIVGITAGAFDFSTGAQAKVGASASVFQVGADGHSTSEQSLIQHDGLESACEKSALINTAPPAGCGALIRIEIVPLPEAAQEQARRAEIADATYSEMREAASVRRSVGTWLTIGGLAVGAAAGTFAVLGSMQNHSIQAGGFANATDLQSAADSGKTFNVLTYVLAPIAVGLVGIGVPVILFNGSPSDPQDVAAVGRNWSLVRGSSH